MIRFKCPNCQTAFEVEDDLAGARVACSECDTHFQVPTLSPDEGNSFVDGVEESVQDNPGKIDLSAELAEFFDSGEQTATSHVDSVPPQPFQQQKLSPRQRRLASDFRMMQEHFSSFPLIHLEQALGNPPERYVVSYHVRGIECLRGNQIVYRDYHEVEIKLPGTYPRTPPTCRMLTPIFHPNIEPAIICIGDHWTAAERLCDLVVRIGEMIAYQAHNIKSPLDGEAAMWTDLHSDMLPIDSRDLTPPES